MYKCNNCGAKFLKPVKNSNMGALWVVFIFLSMGIALILYAILAATKKPSCPRCGDTKIINLNWKEKK